MKRPLPDRCFIMSDLLRAGAWLQVRNRAEAYSYRIIIHKFTRRRARYSNTLEPLL